MKKGFTRKVDRLGRIVIPKEVRDSLGIVEGTPLVLSVEGERLVYSMADGASDVRRAIDDALSALEEHGAHDSVAARLRCALAEASASSPDARELAEGATRCVTLVTCSETVPGMPWRTLVLFVDRNT